MLPISRWLHFPASLFLKLADERIYALVRMGFAFVALLNLIFLWPDRQVFFSDDGMLDAGIAMREANPVYFSVFAFARSEAAVSGVMLGTALALVMLLLGVRARLAAFWVFIWHLSYMARAPLALGGWDLVLRCFSFLVLVSPLGNCWALPALLRGASGMVPAAVPRYGLILMRLQLTVIYAQAVLARIMNPDPYWKNGEFLSYFMLSHHARWPGLWVLQYGSFMVLGTYAVQFSEAAIPILLWIRKTRWWGALMGTLLHAGICVFAGDLGVFCLSMIMTYLAFLRKEDVDGLVGWVRTVTGPKASRSK